MADQNVIGARAMLRLAREWDGAEPQAVAFLRRPNTIVEALSRVGGPLAPRLMLDERLRRAPEGVSEKLPAMLLVPGEFSATLPPAILLVLDFSQVLHLVAVNDDHVLSASKELIEWPLGEVTVRVLRDGRGRFFRPVEIVDRSRSLLVAGPWISSRQRAALERIEQVTGGAGDLLSPQAQSSG